MREAESAPPAAREASHESSMASEAAVVPPVASEATLGLPLMSKAVREPSRVVWGSYRLTDGSVRLVANESSSPRLSLVPFVYLFWISPGCDEPT